MSPVWGMELLHQEARARQFSAYGEGNESMRVAVAGGTGVVRKGPAPIRCGPGRDGATVPAASGAGAS